MTVSLGGGVPSLLDFRSLPLPPPVSEAVAFCRSAHSHPADPRQLLPTTGPQAFARPLALSSPSERICSFGFGRHRCTVKTQMGVPQISSLRPRVTQPAAPSTLYMHIS